MALYGLRICTMLFAIVEEKTLRLEIGNHCLGLAAAPIVIKGSGCSADFCEGKEYLKVLATVATGEADDIPGHYSLFQEIISEAIGAQV